MWQPFNLHLFVTEVFSAGTNFEMIFDDAQIKTGEQPFVISDGNFIAASFDQECLAVHCGRRKKCGTDASDKPERGIA